MSEYTTDNLNLNKPTSGSTTWGDDVNANWDTIDQKITDHSSHLESLDTDSGTMGNEIARLTALQKASSYPNIILNGEFAVDQDGNSTVTNSTGDNYITDGVEVGANVGSLFTI